MMRFRLNSIGEYLDVLEDTSVQIVSKNPIYGIDEVELQRTTELRIPATPHNEELLRLANDYHGRRDMLRGAIPAQMILGIVTYDGVLYINSYDYEKEAYNGVFVYGQMTGLQAIKRLGKLSDWDWSEVDDYIDSDSPIVAAPYAKTNTIRWGRVMYAATEINGSISLTKLLDLINTNTTVRIIYPSGLDGVRIIKGKMAGVDETMTVTATVNPDEDQQPNTSPEEVYNLLSGFNSQYFGMVDNSSFGWYLIFNGQGVQRYWKLQGLRAKFDMSLEMPGDFGAKWFMLKSPDPLTFYGGYSFTDVNGEIIITGEPLGGRVIQLREGDEFYFVNVDDFKTRASEYSGWQFNEGNTFPHNFNLRVISNSRYYLRDNMPDVTLMELIKAVAAITGTAISLNKLQTVVRFTPLDGDWEYKTLDRIIARKTLECAFKDYAQSNLIKFSDDADNDKPIRAAYNIQNTNLQAEKDLYVIPFAAGVEREAGSSLAVGLDGDKDVMADTIDNVNYLQRMTVKKNSVIEEICERANKLQVTCRMSALEYYGIKPQTLYKTLGLRWTWTDLQWQKETATMTLQEYEEPIQPRWYPIIQGDRTLDDMIAELGDLMQTYDDAPETWGGTTKTSAYALSKSAASVQLGGYYTPKSIVYEEGQAPIYVTRNTLINFASTETYKHIVHYNSNWGGNIQMKYVKWIINESATTSPNLRDRTSDARYFHIKANSLLPVWGTPSIYNPIPQGYNGSTYYIPDWWRGVMNPMRFKQCTKLRFSRGVTAFKDGYTFGTKVADLPNLTDIYVHWGLGEVVSDFSAPGFSNPWKLHIPDLGNAEANAALKAEYVSKHWDRVGGGGIFNDVEETEPRERIQ